MGVQPLATEIFEVSKSVLSLVVPERRASKLKIAATDDIPQFTSKTKVILDTVQKPLLAS